MDVGERPSHDIDPVEHDIAWVLIDPSITQDSHAGEVAARVGAEHINLVSAANGVDIVDDVGDKAKGHALFSPIHGEHPVDKRLHFGLVENAVTL